MTLMNNYGPRGPVMDRGEGCRVWDVDGNEYLDFLAGIAVCSLGHNHPALAASLAEQSAKLMHVSNFFNTIPNLEADEELCRALGDGFTLFCNSGTEANEAALKLARRRGVAMDESKYEVVALQNSFHGRTMGALSATMQPGKQDGFGPLVPGFVESAPTADAIAAAVTETTCAVILEPVLGEGGVTPVSDEAMRAAREACDRHNAVLILDEVQTGVGRTGRMWGYEHSGVSPDVVTLAKGLGGGFPVGAMWCSPELGDVLGPGSHGTTYGGNPLASVAVTTVLRTVASDDLVGNAERMGERLAEGLRPLGEVRGRGLLRAVEVGEDAREIAKACLSAGLIVNAVNPTSIRLAPPLVVDSDEVDRAVGILSDCVRN